MKGGLKRAVRWEHLMCREENPLEAAQWKVYQFLLSEGPRSLTELAYELKKKEEDVAKALSALSRQGMVEIGENGKAGLRAK